MSKGKVQIDAKIQEQGFRHLRFELDLTFELCHLTLRFEFLGKSRSHWN
jgi:hypothetical protein